MTKSRRELEKVVDDLAGDGDADTDDVDFEVVAPWVEYDGDAGEDPDVVANYQIVMRRARAEREGVEILGPVDVDDAPEDLVEIAGAGP